MRDKFFYLVLLLAGPLVAQAVGQSLAETSMPLATPSPFPPPGVACSPAPCVLPPTQASEGAYGNTFAPIAASPKNPAHLIVGSYDPNCGMYTQVGFHVSSDAGATWNTTCLPVLSAFGKEFDPGNLPLVGYDLKGAAYIAAGYGVPGPVGPSLIGIEKSADGVTWTAPTVALGNDHSGILYASLAVDQT